LAQHPPPQTGRAAILTEVAAAAGTINGMVGGQVADIRSRGSPSIPKCSKHPPLENRRADPCLFIRRALCAAPAPKMSPACAGFGDTIRMAFQSPTTFWTSKSLSAALGKTAGKDPRNKPTYPAFYGLERSHQIANDWPPKP